MVYRLTHSWSVRTAYYAMALADVAFAGPACAAMLGRSMCEARLRAFAPIGLPYVMVLPHSDGVQVVLMGPADKAGQLEGAETVRRHKLGFAVLN